MNPFSDKTAGLGGYQPRNPPKIVSGPEQNEGGDKSGAKNDAAQNPDVAAQAMLAEIVFVLGALESQQNNFSPSFWDKLKDLFSFGSGRAAEAGNAPDYSSILPSAPSGNGNERSSLRSNAHIDPNAKGRAAHAVQFFVDKGWTPAQAVGITANLLRESNLNPDAKGDSGLAHGIAQWHPDRQDAFRKEFGVDMKNASLDDQLAFVDFELRKGSERQAGAALVHARTPEEAAAIVSCKYERPRDTVVEASKRGQIAEKLASTISVPGVPMA